MDSSDYIDRVYEAAALSYHVKHSVLPDIEINWLNEVICEADYGRFIDVGCGTGLVTRHLVASHLDASGMDISLSMLRLARKQVPSAEFVRANLLSMPFSSSSLKTYISWYSWIHLDNKAIEKALCEAARVLTKRGLLVCLFHCLDQQSDTRARGRYLHISGFMHTRYGLRINLANKNALVRKISEFPFRILYSRERGYNSDMNELKTSRLLVVAERII